VIHIWTLGRAVGPVKIRSAGWLPGEPSALKSLCI
jgi:hypothetical protein